MADEIRATPQNPYTGALARGLRSLQQLAGQYQVDPRIPLLGGTGVDELLSLPGAASLAEDVSYFGPRSLIRGGNVATGGIGTFKPDPRIADVADVAINVAPLGMAAGRAIAALPSAVSRAGRDFIMASGHSVSPLTVYHGSPHKFNKFDSAKIGTGEGNQAYGHGLYLAENPAVAQGYADRLGGGVFGSTSASKGSIADRLSGMFYGDGSNFSRNGRDIGTIAKNMAVKSKVDSDGLTHHMFKDGSEWIGSDAGWDVAATQKNLYKVDLSNELIAKMIDWDKTLGEQNEIIKSAVEKTKLNLPENAIDDLGGDLSLMYGPDVTPNEFLNTWESLGQKSGGELALRKAGIPGIRYLDGGSRSAGQGASNFVVFPGEEDALTILERNGEPLEDMLRRYTTVDEIAPQAKALALAQQRAALPVEKGGLGLPPNNTALERAAAMGFDVDMPFYHGTGADIQAFDPRMAGKNDRGLWGRGQYLTTSPDSANSYALREGDGANVIPAYASVKNPMRITTGSDLVTRMPDGSDTRALIGYNLDGSKIKEIAEAGGHDGVFQIKPSGSVGDIVTFNPDNIRSRFAAFDPFRKSAAIAAAFGVAAPDLLAKDSDMKNQNIGETPPEGYARGGQVRGYARGGQVSGANFPTGDFDPDRIDAIVGELHAMNAA